MNYKCYFERVVLINLKRRPDRLARVMQELKRCKWPFKMPEIFEAVDGHASPTPPKWGFGQGAWGCMQSHKRVLQDAIDDGVEKLLVMEDDVCFADTFCVSIKRFLQKVPDDWDQLMIGGQHFNLHGEPPLVRPGVVRCTDCERPHCHAVRGNYMLKLLERWHGGGPFNGLGHCDWIMGRDPELQFAHKVYAPRKFLAGQERGQSDINGGLLPRKFWNPPGRNLSVICLLAPPEVVAELEQYGFCTGQGCGHDGRLDHALKKIFASTRKNSGVKVEKLCEWINLLQWELAADPQFVCTIAHPGATLELVKAASNWPVTVIQAQSVAQALAQAPRRLRLARSGWPIASAK